MKKIFALFALLLCFVQFSQAGDKVTRDMKYVRQSFHHALTDTHILSVISCPLSGSMHVSNPLSLDVYVLPAARC